MRLKSNFLILWFAIASILLLRCTGAAQNCKSNNDCSERYTCIDDKCKIAKLLPLGFMSTLGFIMLFLLSISACLSGIGGGVFNVPIALMFFKMRMSDAVPVSVCIVCVVMTFRYSYCLVKRLKHPRKDRSIVDYDLAMLISPPIFTGTLLGVILNKMFHEWILLVLYLFVMFYMLTNSYQKWRELDQKEQLKKKKEKKKQNANKDNQEIKLKQINHNYNLLLTEQEIQVSNKVLNNGNGIIKEKTPCKSITKIQSQNNKKPHLESEMSEQLLKITQKEKILIPVKKLSVIIIGIVFLILFSLLKGSDKINSIINVPYCELAYWIIQASYIPVAICLEFVGIQILSKEYANKIQYGYHFKENDIKYDTRNIININISGFIIGFLSAFLGIGGGILITPVMLILKLDPTVASYTASFITLFTSLVNAVQYMLIGIDSWDYIICSSICALGGFIIGLWLLSYVQDSKQSYIVLTLVIVIVMASALVAYQGISDTIEEHQNGINIFAINSIC